MDNEEIQQTEEQKLQEGIVAMEMAIRKLQKAKDKMIIRLEELIENEQIQ